MFGKPKKIVSVAYKEKILAEIAHYEKRIEEALNKRKQYSFEDESFEDVTNPYKFNIQPSQYELKQQEATLSDRASMTLELAMLTIMQSEVNVMVTPPDVRKPVQEDGVWHEVAAECKIDLVSFTITFYAHKPHRKFAPTRYRNVAVTLVKPAHEKELAQSILPKLHLPNLALQVLQSYATAFRSRRTTMLELAERYAEKLKMQAMPEGGYRVRFLDLLQVDWTLENLWSPIVPFCHRMKFEVEYMPKDYISAIGKLYKQFKDPSLETSERTSILSKIFDICLQASGPAREMQESFESDPETAGRLHERRTTINQEPEVPNVEHSPKKQSGKENKAQNRKTNMAPPETIPKKAKKSKPNDKNMSDNRRCVKRALESDGINEAKKFRNDKGDDDNSKGKAGLKGGSSKDKDGETGNVGKKKRDAGKESGGADIEYEAVAVESNAHKRSVKTAAQLANETEKVTPASAKDAMKRGDGKMFKSKTARGDKEDDVGNKNGNKNNDLVNSKDNSEVPSKQPKKRDTNKNDNIVKDGDTNTENNATSSKKGVENTANIQNDKHRNKNTLHNDNTDKHIAISKNGAENKANTENEKPTAKNSVKSKDKNKEKVTVSSKSSETIANTENDINKVGNSKTNRADVDSSKLGTKTVDNDENVTSKKKSVASDVGFSKTRTTYTKDNVADDNLSNKKNVNDTEVASKTSSKTVSSKAGEGSVKEASKNIQNTKRIENVSKNAAKNHKRETNVGGAVQIRGVTDTTKEDVVKNPKENRIVQANKVIYNDVNNVTKNTRDTTNNDKGPKTVAKVAEKQKSKEKSTGTNKKTANDEKNKEKALNENAKVVRTATNNKVTVTKASKTKSVRDDAQKTDKNEEILTKKRKTTEPEAGNTKNKNDQPKKSIVTEKHSNNPKPSLNARVLKENTNRNETIQTAVEKNRTTQVNANKPNNSQKRTNNMLNVTITKSKIIPMSKLPAEKQIKIADKLKTKIPMMKNKMTFSSLSNKLGMNVGKISKEAEKTKIPQKSLPVFKKIAKNVPTRFSPRKMPTFKPSSHGFSNK